MSPRNGRQILEQRHGHRTAADERARFPAGQDLAFDQQFAILDFEPGGFQQAAHGCLVAHIEDAGHARAGFPGADHLRRSAPAQQQAERVHDDGFPAAGLAGQQIQPRVKMDAQALHHRVILDHQLEQHSHADYNEWAHNEEGYSTQRRRERREKRREKRQEEPNKGRIRDGGDWAWLSPEPLDFLERMCVSMLDLRLGDELLFETPVAFLLQTDLWDMVQHSGPALMAVLGVLICFSIYSWTIIFSKLSALRSAGKANSRFLRAFRKASGMEAVMVASEQFRPSPLVAVFDFGYEELERQVKLRGSVTNRTALERTLQLGISEEIAKLERNMSWLATTASVTPFIGLMGTVMGIIRAFQDLSQMGSTSLKAVGPGISEALIATAVGLFAAIPAAIFYNYFGHLIREIGARMDDFSLEFLNMAERSFGE